jgi:hypothetical protein
MTRYLISFPGNAMDVPEEDFPAVGAAAHAVIHEAMAAGVYIFSGGLNEDVAPVRVHEDGSVTTDTYPETKALNGGFAILELDSREAALEWAGKIAVACRCAQEVREWHYDPEI